MNKDFNRLRDLAKQVREITESPLQEEHTKLWTAVNDKKMIKPVVLVRDFGFDMMDWFQFCKISILKSNQYTYFLPLTIKNTKWE